MRFRPRPHPYAVLAKADHHDVVGTVGVNILKLDDYEKRIEGTMHQYL